MCVRRYVHVAYLASSARVKSTMTRACGFFKRWLTIWKRERGRRKERGDFRQWSKKEGETARDGADGCEQAWLAGKAGRTRHGEEEEEEEEEVKWD